MAVILDDMQEDDVTLTVLTDQQDLDKIYESVSIKVNPQGFLIIKNSDGKTLAWYPPETWLKVEFQ